MKIIIFGAAGNVGSRIVNEALSRGHQVSAVVRAASQLEKLPLQVQGLVGDAQNFTEVTELIKRQDLIISAVRPTTGQEQLLVTISETILEAAQIDSIRVLLVGGAATLNLPQQNETVLSAKGFLPAEVVPIATACLAQHQAVVQSANSQWALLSPPAMLVPGIRTGRYQLGKDELLYDDQGNSQISMEDFAMALVDEAEQPKHQGERFTVAN